MPAQGVYAVRARVDGGPPLPGVANLGVRPTFDGATLLLEVHLLDRALDLYGRELQVDFVDRIRGERRFPGVDALVARIRQDVEQARQLLAAASAG
jgi:riboflavin kinase/FMN adenylyltransferase